MFLAFKIIDEYFNHNNLFNKFLMERYLYKIDFKKIFGIIKIKNKVFTKLIMQNIIQLLTRERRKKQ